MRIAEREAKPRGEGWRDMRLSRNRGNARGPTRLTNPLHRATSCRTRAFARSIARSLARLATKPSLAVFFLFPFPRRRETLFFSLRLSAIPPTFSSFLRSSCLLPACPFSSPPLPRACLPSLRPPFTPCFLRARCILSTFPSSTIHPPPVFIFRYSFFPVPSSSSVILPMSTSLCSAISSSCSHRIPSLPAREVHPPASSAYFFVCEYYKPSLSVAHARLECFCHIFATESQLDYSVLSMVLRVCFSHRNFSRHKNRNTTIDKFQRFSQMNKELNRQIRNCFRVFIYKLSATQM